MSNQYAIAAVTRTIQNMLEEEKIRVTTLTPDLASRETGKRINLFLYHTMHNPTWRNQDIPGRVRKSERGNPPLALNLHYLLTAYGEEGTNLADQELLGTAMRVLHDRPILKSKSIIDALVNYPKLAQSELAEQIEKVRIIPDFLDIENMSRLWTTFQTQYRVSAAYQASVVLIESLRPTTSPMPVAKRGEDDQGVLSDVGMEAIISSIEYRGDPGEPTLPSATVGSTITILGANLPQVGIVAVFRDPEVDASDDPEVDVIARLSPEPGGTDQKMRIRLEESAGLWRAGLVSLSLELKTEDRVRTSNSIPVAIAPQVLTSGGDASVVALVDEEGGKRLLSVSLANPVGLKSKVFLTLNPYVSTKRDSGFFQIPAGLFSIGSSLAPVFDISKVPSGDYWVRVRVEGIDSMLMQKVLNPETGRYQVQFDPQQRIQL